MTSWMRAARHASTTSDKDRKRLLRALVADVTLQADPADPLMRLGLRWRSGAVETLVVPRPLGRRTRPEAIALVTHQSDRSDHEVIAALAAAGFTTATGRPFDRKALRGLRRRHQLPRPRPRLSAAGNVTAVDVARRLGVAKDVVYYWLTHGHLDAHRDTRGHWHVPFSAAVEEACRQRVLASSRIKPRPQPLAPGGAV